MKNNKGRLKRIFKKENFKKYVELFLYLLWIILVIIIYVFFFFIIFEVLNTSDPSSFLELDFYFKRIFFKISFFVIVGWFIYFLGMPIR